MARKTNIRSLMQFLVLIFSIPFFCLFYGCGTAEEGTTIIGTGGLQVALTGSPTSLAAGQNSILTATVTDGSGKVVSGQTVVFSFISNPSGATVATLNGGTTDASGRALAVYTAGKTTPASSVQDMIQASVPGSAGIVVITRTTGTGTGTDSILSLSASLSTVNGGQMSVITATVYSSTGAGGGVSNQTITFTIPVNNSGASFIDSSGASVSTITIPMQLGSNYTYISATYKAGTNVSSTGVEDMVQAVLGSGSTSSILIYRTASAAGTYAVSISSSPARVTAGQVSIITATVTSGSASAGGVTVGFTLPVNQSGATLSSATAITDGNGKAVVIYQPGANTPTMEVQDVIQASITGYTSAIIITRTVSTAGTYAVSISSSPASVTAGQVSIITATVTSGSAFAGVTVTFTLPVNLNQSGATLSSATATTDSDGKAVVIYQPGPASPTLTVQDTVQAAVGTAANTVVITRVGSAASAYGITVTASPATLATKGSNSVIRANVTNSAGTAISGVTVNFAVTGVLPVGTLSVASATTDGSGNAVTTFTGNSVAAIGATSVVTASITVSGNTYTNAVIITYP